MAEGGGEVEAPGAGRVESIWVAGGPAAPMRAVDEARALAGLGLEGDRYVDGRGTFSAWPGGGRHLTLVAAEALEAVERELGVALPPGATRRNVVVRGVDLDALIGRDFTLGEARVRGARRCEPCEHLVALLGDARLLRALARRGGLRCDIVASGVVRPGDPLRALAVEAQGGDDELVCEVRRP